MFRRCKEEQKQNLYISEIKNKLYWKKGTICYFLAKKRYIFASGITSQDIRGVLAVSYCESEKYFSRLGSTFAWMTPPSTFSPSTSL